LPSRRFRRPGVDVRAGVAYPIRAQMLGSGVGAERHCVFSTGAFVEPIEVWDEPRLLKFSVTSNPAPMEEWTPYSHIDPPHLHDFWCRRADNSCSRHWPTEARAWKAQPGTGMGFGRSDIGGCGRMRLFTGFICAC